ncbi:MAG: iron-sulfur cluster assembly scaffold protein [Armatimonadetes bacterium]|nr:iron-sulfur cluster assembly scaffold protein [Armatimonadota bacterium]
MDSFSDLQEEVLQEALAAGFTRTALDHAMNPRNVGSLDVPDATASVVGPCADTMSMWLRVREGRIAALTFWTDGCGPTIATGSITTELAKGKTVGEALRLHAQDVLDALGGLPEGHHHCAQLAADTLRATLKDYLTNGREPWRRLYRTG